MDYFFLFHEVLRTWLRYLSQFYPFELFIFKMQRYKYTYDRVLLSKIADCVRTCWCV